MVSYHIFWNGFDSVIPQCPLHVCFIPETGNASIRMAIRIVVWLEVG